MPDIAMCKGGTCPVRDRCYRFTATPDRRQSYFANPPFHTVTIDDKPNVSCVHFYPNDSRGGR